MRPRESFIGQPVRSLQTMLRIIAQEDPSQPSVVPDGIYGPTTAAAVTAFQRRHSLPITGIADQRTWEAIVTVYAPALEKVGLTQPIEIVLEPAQSLRPGESNPYLYLAQGMLTVLAQGYQGLKTPTQNGTMDTSTIAAVTAFQHFSGMPETGNLDRATWRRLAHQFTLYANYNSRL